MSLPSNPTRSFVARNPHLYGMKSMKTEDHLLEAGQMVSDAVPAGEEITLQREIVANLEFRRWAYVWHRPDKKSTCSLGVPDFVVAAPSRTLWVECKTRTGKLSVDQQLFKNRLEANGHVLHVVRSFSEWMRLANGE